MATNTQNPTFPSFVFSKKTMEEHFSDFSERRVGNLLPTRFNEFSGCLKVQKSNILTPFIYRT
ncbi:MAG: hypothetical protein IJV35_09820 [Neisseriaceae bacterium]|nr:hypothetical protein [Neisseriaceae bacterium]